MTNGLNDMLRLAAEAPTVDLFALWLPYLALWGFLLLCSLLVYVLNGIFVSKIFVKTGAEGWPAWLPIYNSWRLLEIGGQAGWLALLALVPGAGIVTVVFLVIAVNNINRGFGKTGGWTVLYIFLPLVWGAYLAYGRTEPWRAPAPADSWAPPSPPYPPQPTQSI
ncbi:DUF5684 domain-containing protein [Agromyces sp. NPDC057679]|uniref:DUF5684 domain-containing protein n=1 Tax=Agromyces sp. NPDC057679 TaxID=3346207 RepID=UPI00366BFFA9